MEALREVANIAGKSGLYRILKPSRSGVVVESLDDKKTKELIGPTARVSVLKDISIYTDNEQESAPLGDVFGAIFAKYGDNLPVVAKSASNSELADFLAEVLPEYDRDRVHMSDVKKLITWYGILRTNMPEAFEAAAPAEASSEESVETPEGETAAE
ncbi:DUF5606 family protein [Tellurirhabdus rosea]|uniref:DUF5606 family protein n=1 Tax=Tellurirhabdus rosea TaxID=2674997 RepID=UPI0022565420|nr:DUF5606 domain-containing protein [Tellurirhabdus rosea]